jgi:hypothetical protein
MQLQSQHLLGRQPVAQLLSDRRAAAGRLLREAGYGHQSGFVQWLKSSANSITICLIEASSFTIDPDGCMADLYSTLNPRTLLRLRQFFF